jgi:hypothetical protein
LIPPAGATDRSPRAAARLALLGSALAVASALLAVQLARSASPLDLPLYDYVAFWAAGCLNHAGADPYDPESLATLQREAAPGQGVLVMWPAPWALTLLAPFSRLDSHSGHLLWVLLQLAVLIGAVDWAWRLAGGPAEKRWVAWLVTFTFPPTYFVLVTGQLGALLLLGLVGFLHFIKRGRDAVAGAFLVLVAIKPQLSYLFWVALLLWAVQGRRWRVVLGGALAGLLALALPLLENLHLLSHYWHALTRRTPTHSHLSPLPGTALRLLLDREAFWLQFAPTVPGLLWLAWYWRRHRRSWDWQRQAPALLFASLLTASYGAWPFDLVVLLPAILQVAVQLPAAPRRVAALALALHLTVGTLALAQVLREAEYFWFLWLVPALLLCCALVRWRVRSEADEKLLPLAA